MHARSRLRSLAAVAAGLLLSLGVALPASAAPASPDLISPDSVNPGQLRVLQREAALSTVQAGQRLANEAAAGTVVSTLQAALGRSFGGAWFEPGSTDLVVATTDAAAAQRVRAAGAQPRLVSRDLVMLEGVMAVLDSRAGSVPDTVTGWRIDPASNAVVVSSTDDAAGKAFAAGQDAVRVEHVPARPVPLANLRGGDGISSSEGGFCSVGFNATSGRTRYIITAGHCTKMGGTWSGDNGSAIGPVAKSTFPDHDFGLIEVTSDSWRQTHDIDTDRGYVTVTGVTPVAVGSSVCRSGSSSGYQCGKVKATGMTVNYGDGNVVNGLTQTSACAEGGDSGGPFISGSQAQGTLSGGSGGCLLGGDTYFQPIGEVLSTYGLTLLTGDESDDDS